jgi:hypothetical protein
MPEKCGEWVLEISFMCCRESTFYSRGGCIALLVLGWFSKDLIIRFGKS